MDRCGCCWRTINSIHTEQSVVCRLRDCWEAMDTKLFVLLPEMFPLPLFETTTATSYSRLWSLSEQWEHSCTSWRCFSWAAVWSDYSVWIANPARLMNNLGCDWTVPDGWNEMPPLAFHQLGEVIIPTGWWLLFWITDVHEEPTKYP